MSNETQTIVRSRRCGLRDIYIAKVKKNTADVYEAGTPFKFARAIKAKITDSYNSEKIYSDDSTEDIVNSYQGTTIELEVNTLAPQDRAVLWNRLWAEGYLVEASEDTPPELALGYRTRQLNGKYEFVWYYCGKFDQGQDEEYNTIEDKKNAVTSTIKASFYERAMVNILPNAETGEDEEKHLVRIRVDESNLATEAAAAANAIKAWFAKVQEYPGTTTDDGTEDTGENGEDPEAANGESGTT